MRVVAITACPTGIAHTYMAAEALIKSAAKYNVKIKVETQGAMGVENSLTPRDILLAHKVLIASDIEIEALNRFDDKEVTQISIHEVLIDTDKVLSSLVNN